MDIRQEPYYINQYQEKRPWDLSESFFITIQSEWSYNALDEITLETPQMTWSKDEWAFTPVNFTLMPNVRGSQKISPKDDTTHTMGVLFSAANVSLITSALRSRLECSAMTVPADSWLDRAADVNPDRTNETLNGYVRPTGLFATENYKIPVFSASRRITCCVNGTGTHTGSNGQSVVAYWSSNISMVQLRPREPVDENGPQDLVVHSPWYRNFTIKGIAGSAATARISGANPDSSQVILGCALNSIVGQADETLLYFPKEPTMSIMNCILVIENATTNVTVVQSTGQILEYSTIGIPQSAPGAWDYAYDIIYPEP